MAGPLFHIDNGGRLTALRSAPFVSDVEIQALIAENPALLAGDPEAGDTPFVIERVGPPPAGATRTPRWSVDHLFLGPDAVPTVVETRRAADPPATGDLFGQILFYAANAGVWWPVEELRTAFDATHGGPGCDPGGVLAAFIGDQSPGAYWNRVAENLGAGRVRMVLVVDRVAPELARMVAFLGGQLRDAEIRVLEVRQHVGPSGRLLELVLTTATPRPPPAPVVVERPPPPVSAHAQTHAPSPREAWARALRARCDEAERTVLDDLLRWMGEQYGATFVTGPPDPAFRLAVKEAGQDRFPFAVTEAKTAAIHLGSLSASRAFEAEDARRALVEELADAGLDVESPDLRSDISIPLERLREPGRRARLLAILDGVIESLRLKEAPSAFLL